MTVMLMLAGALLSQSAVLIDARTGEVGKSDVAYTELSQGQNDAVIAQLRARANDDPAALINLGTAYARKGMRREAMASFTRAMTSNQRYQLQLSDGRWVDSRIAAQMAAAQLGTTSTLAAR